MAPGRGSPGPPCPARRVAVLPGPLRCAARGVSLVEGSQSLRLRKTSLPETQGYYFCAV